MRCYLLLPRSCVLALTCLTLAINSSPASVSIEFGFGWLREPSGEIATPGSLGVLLVAPPGETLPGGLQVNSSLSENNIATARADFGGASIVPGSVIGNSLIVATGQIDEQGDFQKLIVWDDQGYEMIEVGDLIGFYWFPGIAAETGVLPESDFSIGGMQESQLSGGEFDGNQAMIVPPNVGSNWTIAYFDADSTGDPSSLPPSRFTAIHVPPSGYQVWRDLEFTQAQIEAGAAAPEADPDGDGLPNLLEYATGSSPLEPSTNPLTIAHGDETLRLQFNQIADPELRYRIEATDDLSLSPWPEVVFESSGVDNVGEQIEISPPLSSGQRFFRLRVDFLVE